MVPPDQYSLARSTCSPYDSYFSCQQSFRSDQLIWCVFPQFSARKPDWETGTSTALPHSSKLKTAAPAAPAQQQLNRDVWKMAADEEDEELLDDEELLTEEDLKRPEVPSEWCRLLWS